MLWACGTMYVHDVVMVLWHVNFLYCTLCSTCISLCFTSDVGVCVLCRCMHVYFIVLYTRCRYMCCMLGVVASIAWCCMSCVVICVWCTLCVCVHDWREEKALGYFRVWQPIRCVCRKNKGKSKDQWRISIDILFEF